jgi:hypothetical protein
MKRRQCDRRSSKNEKNEVEIKRARDAKGDYVKVCKNSNCTKHHPLKLSANSSDSDIGLRNLQPKSRKITRLESSSSEDDVQPTKLFLNNKRSDFSIQQSSSDVSTETIRFFKKFTKGYLPFRTYLSNILKSNESISSTEDSNLEIAQNGTQLKRCKSETKCRDSSEFKCCRHSLSSCYFNSADKIKASFSFEREFFTLKNVKLSQAVATPSQSRKSNGNSQCSIL